jgi:hypothetical protein
LGVGLVLLTKCPEQRQFSVLFDAIVKSPGMAAQKTQNGILLMRSGAA